MGVAFWLGDAFDGSCLYMTVLERWSKVLREGEVPLPFMRVSSS